VTLLDANYILRWFLNDVVEQANIVAKLLAISKPNSLVVDRVNLAEVTYILRVQGYNRQQVAQVFDALYSYPSLASIDETDQLAIEVFRDTNLDFEDCVLAAWHKVKGYKVATFDKELQKRLAQTS
jgi:predicted nucleic-acid-binding protein